MVRCSITILFLFTANLVSAQELRTWKDADGREMTGEMVEKSDSSVIVRAGGKNFEIPLELLSSECRDYVRNHVIQTPVVLRVDTVSQSADAGNTNFRKGRVTGARTVRVHVSRVEKRNLQVEVVWIGSNHRTDRYGIYSVERKPIRHDGAVDFSVVFEKKRRGKRGRDYFGDDYKAYAVRVLDEHGNEVGRTASMKPYERFLDEAAEWCERNEKKRLKDRRFRNPRNDAE